MKKRFHFIKLIDTRRILAVLLTEILLLSTLTPLNAADDNTADTQAQISVLENPSLFTETMNAGITDSDESGGGETPEQQGLNTAMQYIGGTDPLSGIRSEMVPTANLTGAANYSYRFELPKGIGVQPELAVTYSSDAQYGNAGWGWNLLTSKIEVKTTKNAIPILPVYDQSSDILLINGQELVKIGGDAQGVRQYRLKSESSFILVVQEGDGYKEMRPDGSAFYYGQSTESRLDNPNDIGEVYQWYLDKAEDKYGNIMTYEYERNLNAVYPVRINYAYLKDSMGNLSGDYLYTIKLIWQNRLPENQCEPASWRTGFPITYNRLLQQVEIYSHPSSGSEILDKAYTLNYTTGSFGKQLLAKIEEKKPDDANGMQWSTVNSASYGYEATSDNLFGDLTVTGAVNALFAPGTTTHVVDLNGDGQIDFYHSDEKLYTYDNGILTSKLYATNNGFSAFDYWCYFSDYNSDGMPDILHKMVNIFFALNTGNGYTSILFQNNDKLDLVPPISGPDFNGDGIPDKMELVNEDSMVSPGTPGVSNLYNHINLGDGHDGYTQTYVYESDTEPFDPPEIIDYYPNEYIVSSSYMEKIVFKDYNWGRMDPANEAYIDVNGDGLADKVVYKKYSWHTPQCNISKGNSLPCNCTPTIIEPGIYLNTGKNFLPKPIPISDNLKFNNLIEMNGDGFSDAVTNDGVLINKWAKVNTLKTITNDVTGVTTELAYQQSYFDPNRTKTLNYRQKRSLASVTTGNEFTKVTVNYEYANGVYDRREKEFRGFGLVTTKVKDTDKNVTHIAESYYNVGTIIGYDKNNIVPVYDPYFKGKLERTVSKIQLTDGTVKKYGTETLYKYAKTKVFGSSIEKGKPDVQYVYPNEVRFWTYNDQGAFLGTDAANGDLMSRSDFFFDPATGLLIQQKSRNYVYSYSSAMFRQYGYNEVINFVNYAVGTDGYWLNLPIKSLTYYNPGDNRCECYETISGKMYIYDNRQTRDIYYEYPPLISQLGTNRLMREVTLNNRGDNAETSYTYDVYGNINSATDYSGLTTAIETAYRPADRTEQMIRITTVYPDGLTGVSYIDYRGRLSEQQDVYGDTVRYDYDYMGRNTAVTENINGNEYLTQKYSYNNRVMTHYITGKYYKEFSSKALSLHNPDAADENNRYLTVETLNDSLGRILHFGKDTIVNGQRCWTNFGFLDRDSMGRVISVRKPYTLSSAAHDLLITVPYDLYFAQDKYNQKYQYDNFGRVVKITQPCGGTIGDYVTTLTYNSLRTAVPDTSGNTFTRIVNMRTVTDGYKQITETNDLYGNFLKSEEKRSTGTNAVTIAESNLTGYSRIQDPIGLLSESQTNILGELVWKRTPDGGKTEYTYNDQHLVTGINEYGRNETDYRTINLSYDSLNRLTGISYPDSTDNVVYDYYNTDEMVSAYNRGQLKSVTRGTYFKAEYNNGDFWNEERKTIEGAGSAFSTKYLYNIQGQITELTCPDGEIVRYSYNETGDLKNITGNQTYLEYVNYNQMGQRTEVKYGNGNVIKYDYDTNTDFVNTMTSLSKTGTELLKYNYIYGKDLNLTQIKDTPGDIAKSEQNYSYYAEGTLKNGNCTTYPANYGYDQTFTFDNAGRMTSQTLSGAKYTYHYSSANHAADSIDVTNKADLQRINFTYDEYGNMTKKSLVNGADTKEMLMSFNDSNELTHINLTNGRKLDFTYDAGGQRISKIYRNETGGVISDNIFVNGFYTLKNGVPTKHISDGNKIFATIVDNDPGKILYYTQGNLGSTNLLTDNNGSQKAKYLYRPFGGLDLQLDASNNATWDHFEVEHRYSGYMEDQESGLNYLNARYYDPMVAQFLTVDPAESGLNHYGYTTNPVMFSDPTGFDPHYEDPSKPPYDVTTKPKHGDGNGGGYNGGSNNSAPKPKEVIYFWNNHKMGADGIPYQGWDSIWPEADPETEARLKNEDPVTAPPKIRPELSCSKTQVGNSGNENTQPPPIIPPKVIINTGESQYTRTNEPWDPDIDTDDGNLIFLFGGLLGKLKFFRYILPPPVKTWCFVAGTKVLTENGYINIEDIKPGDKVFSYNFESRLYELKTVLDTFISFTEDIVEITINDDVIESTLSHKFWVESEKVWIEAKNLKPGMILKSNDDNYCSINEIRIYKSINAVYNLEVEDNHNYFVSESNILVHNGEPDIYFKEFNQALREAMTWLSERGFKAETQHINKWTGKPDGMMSADRKIGFRIEFDQRSGAHINVWSGKNDGPHYRFNASERTVNRLVKQFYCR